MIKTMLKTSSLLFGLTLSVPAFAGYDGSTFDDVWGKVTSDPYDKPFNKVTAASMFDGLISLIEQAASRTITNQDDLLPRFTKLVHPNGICLRGEWTIDQASPYSGYFAQGSKGLAIVRASSAFSTVNSGDIRSFGLAVKVFPTLDATAKVKTGNFFTIDDFGGTPAARFLDTSLTNEPPSTVRPEAISMADVASAVGKAFSLVDIKPNKRQLYLVSELAVPAGAPVRTPGLIRLSAAAGQVRVDERDFRDELNPRLYPNETILVSIEVAPEAAADGSAVWTKIGQIALTDSVISDSCDHALHFTHPKWRN